jgi:hypothetical protein
MKASAIRFSKAQLDKASIKPVKPCHEHCATIAVETFGDHARYAAKLCRDRFGNPVVFVCDAEQVDSARLPVVVWQGEPDALRTAKF